MVTLIVTLVVIGILILIQRYVQPPAKVALMVIFVVALAIYLWRAIGGTQAIN
jgi:hypothetical protein